MHYMKYGKILLLLAFISFCLSGLATQRVVTLRSLGARADGRADDTPVIKKALDVSSQRGGIIDGEGMKYKVKGSLSFSGDDIQMRNIQFVMDSKFQDQMNMKLNVRNVDLFNIKIIGYRGKSDELEDWETFAVENNVQSIRPKQDQAIYIITNSENSKINITNFFAQDLHMKTCLLVSTFGTVNMKNLFFSNLSNKTFHIFHSRDDGKYSNGTTKASDIVAQNIGVLPSRIRVNGVNYTTGLGKYMPQESFNFIVSFGDYYAFNVKVDDFGSTGLTSDRNRYFECSAVRIVSNSSKAYSNNPSGALWIEASKKSVIKNVFIDIKDRNVKDLEFDNSAIHLYGINSSFLLDSITIRGSNTIKLNKGIRGSLMNENDVLLNNIDITGRYKSGSIYLANMNKEPTSKVTINNTNVEDNVFFWGVSEVEYVGLKSGNEKCKITYLLPHNPRKIGKIKGANSNITDIVVSESSSTVDIEEGLKRVNILKR